MDTYLGEIRPFSLDFAPKGWHLCDGAILPISENQALFALLGNTFGGTSPNTFALPDLRGRCIVGFGQSPQSGTIYNRGEAGGAETVTLTPQNLPPHTHNVQAEAAQGTQHIPGNLPAVPDVPSMTGLEMDIYAYESTQQVSLNPQSVSTVGGTKSHNNMQPFQVINYCIATSGYFPPRD